MAALAGLFLGGLVAVLMHSVLLPNTTKVHDQSALWDYATPAGSYSAPGNQPASLPGHNANTSDM